MSRLWSIFRLVDGIMWINEKRFVQLSEGPRSQIQKKQEQQENTKQKKTKNNKVSNKFINLCFLRNLTSFLRILA